MIDLHTHTTASDGRCTPAELVTRARGAGVTVLSVTDHDTVGACDRVSMACVDAGIEFVPGIEISAIKGDVDVHVLGYFIDVASSALRAFLDEQRLLRVDRVRRIVGRLATVGILLDAEAIVRPALEDPTRSAGRPWIARALVAEGHAASTDEAFERWLVPGTPAFVGRLGASPEDVFARIHEARGLASLAHPGLVGHDEWIHGFVGSGLDAIEAYHSEHDADATAHYASMASGLGVAITGGSDFHGDETHGAVSPGSVSLPRERYEQLVQLKAR